MPRRSKRSRISKFSYRVSPQKVNIPSFMEVNDESLPYETFPARGFIESIKSFFGYYNDEDDSVWIDHRERMLKHIYKLLGDDNAIPVGIKLYHGTINPNLDINSLRNRMTFLGLEPIISVWYTAEESDYKGIVDPSRRSNFGYVYEFEVLKPIPADKVIKYISLNPKGEDICKNGGVCIHPQITFHNYMEEGPLDFSIEVTLMLKKMINEGYLNLTKRYRTNFLNLKNMLYQPFSKLNLYLDGDLFILWPKDRSREELNKYVESLKNMPEYTPTK
jgi:hypothetical protein